MATKNKVIDLKEFADIKLGNIDGTKKFAKFALDLIGNGILQGGDTKLNEKKLVTNEITQQTSGSSFFADFYFVVIAKNETAILMNFRWKIYDQKTFNKIFRIIERIKSIQNSGMKITTTKSSKK